MSASAERGNNRLNGWYNSLHAGQVIVADGTPQMAERLQRVLTNDPGIGVARHADAGYDIAQAVVVPVPLKLTNSLNSVGGTSQSIARV